MYIRTCYGFTPVQPSSYQDTTLQQVLQMQKKIKGDSSFCHLILIMLKVLLQEKLLTFVEIHRLQQENNGRSVCTSRFFNSCPPALKGNTRFSNLQCCFPSWGLGLVLLFIPAMPVRNIECFSGSLWERAIYKPHIAYYSPSLTISIVSKRDGVEWLLRFETFMHV